MTRKGPGNAVALTVNGQPVAGTVIPPVGSNQPVTVEAALGEA